MPRAQANNQIQLVQPYSVHKRTQSLLRYKGETTSDARERTSACEIACARRYVHYAASMAYLNTQICSDATLQCAQADTAPTALRGVHGIRGVSGCGACEIACARQLLHVDRL